MNRNKILVTAGNTRVPIDKVRGIDNIFKGKTGAAIAEYFAGKRCDVTVLTSHPDLVAQNNGLEIIRFRTYDELLHAMEDLIRNRTFDVVIHSAAVSDYQVGGMYRQVGNMHELDGRMLRELAELDRSGKIGSDHTELWMKLVATMKIVDQIRNPWGFKGVLVKFKLQVCMDDTQLVEVARRSMEHSKADFIVANTLEGLAQKAFLISARHPRPIRVSRNALPAILYKEIGL